MLLSLPPAGSAALPPLSPGAASAAAAAAAAWLAKRSSDSSCQSFLDWHSAGGHVARRKQSAPRRSPLL